MQTGVNYEGPYDWHYGVTDSEIDQDFALFKENKVNLIVVNLLWSTFEPSRGSYDQYNINNVKRVLTKANQHGIDVCLSFFQYFQDTTMGVPSYVVCPYTDQRRTIAIVRSEDLKNAFLDMVEYLVNEFKGYACIKSWSLLNEPMHSGGFYPDRATERENFHRLIEEGSDLIKSLDSRPVLVRFTLPYSPWFSRSGGDDFLDFNRVMNAVDIMSINVYGDACDDNTTWEEVNWRIFEQAVADTKLLGKPFWVSEYGSRGDDETQRVKYVCAMSRFQNVGVDRVYAWDWIHNDGDEDWNICESGGVPRPAFYELAEGTTPPPPPPSLETLPIFLAGLLLLYLG